MMSISCKNAVLYHGGRGGGANASWMVCSLINLKILTKKTNFTSLEPILRDYKFSYLFILVLINNLNYKILFQKAYLSSAYSFSIATTISISRKKIFLIKYCIS